MVSMSYCKVGASLPSDPNGHCLVFLITFESFKHECGGIRFYREHTMGAKCSSWLTFSPIYSGEKLHF